jgi:hypothetical protein
VGGGGGGVAGRSFVGDEGIGDADDRFKCCSCCSDASGRGGRLSKALFLGKAMVGAEMTACLSGASPGVASGRFCFSDISIGALSPGSALDVVSKCFSLFSDGMVSFLVVMEAS